MGRKYAVLDPAILPIFLVASLALVLVPGPDLVQVLARGVAQGPGHGIAAAAGVACGIAGHTVLAAAGLSALLAASPVAFDAVRYAGAAYLLYAGVRLWCERGASEAAAGARSQRRVDVFRQSALTNLLNPKVALFFLAFLPQFADPARGAVSTQLATLGIVYLGVTLAVYGPAGMIAGRLARFCRRRSTGSRLLTRAGGSVLVALGLRLAWGGA